MSIAEGSMNVLGDQDDILFSPGQKPNSTVASRCKAQYYCGNLWYLHVSARISRILRVKPLHVRSKPEECMDILLFSCPGGPLSLSVWSDMNMWWNMVNVLSVFFQVELHPVAGLYHCRLHTQGTALICGTFLVAACRGRQATRGRWKALSSIAVVGWSGSAAVGGWLIETWWAPSQGIKVWDGHWHVNSKHSGKTKSRTRFRLISPAGRLQLVSFSISPHLDAARR